MSRIGVFRATSCVMGSLALTAMLVASDGTPVLGAEPCRVRNVTRDTAGHSLNAMVNAALDGDRLLVRGTCDGGVVIKSDLVIHGVASGATLDGGGHGRVLEVGTGTSVTLANLTITRGAAATGGGILNAGTLTLIDTTVQGNLAGAPSYLDRSHDARGGGIANVGTLTLIASQVRGNEAASGGGIENVGTLTMTTTTVARNTAATWWESGGGGISNLGTLTMTDSSVISNVALSGQGSTAGGGIFNSGDLSVTNSTVSGNAVLGNNSGDGGGIANGAEYFGTGGDLVLTAVTVTNNGGLPKSTVKWARPWRCRCGPWSGGVHAGGVLSQRYLGGTATVRASIIAGNTGGASRYSTAPDCAGRFTSAGENLIGVSQSCRGFDDGADGDQVGRSSDPIDPRLGLLSDNRGPTQTHSLLPGSPAIDGAGAGPCAAPKDQRGVPRPQGRGCDVGAFEHTSMSLPSTDRPPAGPADIPVYAYLLAVFAGGFAVFSRGLRRHSSRQCGIAS